MSRATRWVLGSTGSAVRTSIHLQSAQRRPSDAASHGGEVATAAVALWWQATRHRDGRGECEHNAAKGYSLCGCVSAVKQIPATFPANHPQRKKPPTSGTVPLLQPLDLRCPTAFHRSRPCQLGNWPPLCCSAEPLDTPVCIL